MTSCFYKPYLNTYHSTPGSWIRLCLWCLLINQPTSNSASISHLTRTCLTNLSHYFYYNNICWGILTIKPCISKLPVFKCLRKIAKSDCYLRHVWPAFLLHRQLGSYWKDFQGTWYFDIFRKSVKEIQDYFLNSDKTKKHFIWAPCICIYS